MKAIRALSTLIWYVIHLACFLVSATSLLCAIRSTGRCNLPSPAFKARDFYDLTSPQLSNTVTMRCAIHASQMQRTKLLASSCNSRLSPILFLLCSRNDRPYSCRAKFSTITHTSHTPCTKCSALLRAELVSSLTTKNQNGSLFSKIAS